MCDEWISVNDKLPEMGKKSFATTSISDTAITIGCTGRLTEDILSMVISAANRQTDERQKSCAGCLCQKHQRAMKMKRDELIAYLREYADWASSGKWVTPICLSDHLTEAANVIEEYEEREGQEMSINQENDQSLMHNNICGELHELYREKNHDYGDSFHKSYEEFGLTMAAIRINDKVNRFKTLIKGQVNDESIRDTLLDAANYCIMTVMELDKERDTF